MSHGNIWSSKAQKALEQLIDSQGNLKSAGVEKESTPSRWTSRGMVAVKKIVAKVTRRRGNL